MTKLLHLLRDQKAATAIEYGLIAALICLGALTAMVSFGDSATAIWTSVQNESVKAMGQ